MLKVSLLLSAFVGLASFAGNLHDRLPPVTKPIFKETVCPPGTHPEQFYVPGVGGHGTRCAPDTKWPSKPPGF